MGVLWPVTAIKVVILSFCSKTVSQNGINPGFNHQRNNMNKNNKHLKQA